MLLYLVALVHTAYWQSSEADIAGATIRIAVWLRNVDEMCNWLPHVLRPSGETSTI
jgi:hypothetical protein